MASIKDHFPVQKGTKRKRVNSEVEDGEITEERGGGEDSNGGASEAGQGLSHKSVSMPKRMPNLQSTVVRVLRFSFVNSTEDTGFTAGEGVWSQASDFFEIPQNHLGFYLPGAFMQMMRYMPYYKISNAGWRITNLQFIAAQETIPPSTTPPISFEVQGNVNFTVDTLKYPPVQSSGRKRFWTYDGYGRQRSEFNNSSIMAAQRAARAENETMALPVIQWDEWGPTGVEPKPFPTYRYTKNHKLDSSIGNECQVIGGWRRNVAAGHTPVSNYAYSEAIYNGAADVMTEARSSMPLHTRARGAGAGEIANITAMYNDLIGSDAKTRQFTYHNEYDGTLIKKINPDFFIRIRDPPRWGVGATAGSQNDEPASILAIKCVIDIETHIDFDIKTEVIQPNDETIDQWTHNDLAIERHYKSDYTVNSWSTRQITNPGGLAPTAPMPEIPGAPMDTPLCTD